MRRRSAAGILAGLVALLLAFCAYVYAMNARLLDRRYPVQPVGLAGTSGPEAIARGKRLADLTGCTDCHRPNLQGGTFGKPSWLRGRYYAANLTRKALLYSDAELARIVREGVRPDGRGVVAMPSMGYMHITDDEMADLVAFIRAMPAGGDEQPSHWMGPLEQWDLWRGAFRPTIGYVEVERAKVLPAAGERNRAGRHVVAVACIECHGGDLTGHGWDGDAPDLRIVQAYDAASFARLMRTGIGADGKDHGLMSEVARSRFSTLSDGEVAAVFDYLTARAAQPR